VYLSNSLRGGVRHLRGCGEYEGGEEPPPWTKNFKSSCLEELPRSLHTFEEFLAHGGSGGPAAVLATTVHSAKGNEFLDCSTLVLDDVLDSEPVLCVAVTRSVGGSLVLGPRAAEFFGISWGEDGSIAV
jgi:hypothetical protein